MGLARAGSVLIDAGSGVAQGGVALAGIAAQGNVVWRRQAAVRNFLVSYNVGDWSTAAWPGFVGCWFTVGSRALEVVSLGRLFNPNDPRASSVIGIYDATSFAALATTILDHPGGLQRWVWNVLSPTTVPAGGQYLLWIDRAAPWGFAEVTGIVASADFAAMGTSWDGAPFGAQGEMWGPLDMQYRML